MQTCAETHVNRTREQVLSVQGSWRTNLEQVLGRACVFALHGGSQSLMQGRAEQTCGKWRKQNVVAPPRSSAGRPTRWLWSLSRGQLPCDLSFVERLRFDGNPKPNTYENQHCPSGRFGSQMTPRFNLLEIVNAASYTGPRCPVVGVDIRCSGVVLAGILGSFWRANTPKCE